MKMLIHAHFIQRTIFTRKVGQTDLDYGVGLKVH